MPSFLSSLLLVESLPVQLADFEGPHEVLGVPPPELCHLLKELVSFGSHSIHTEIIVVIVIRSSLMS